MSQINRLLVSRGPALVTYRGGKFFSKADIAIDLSKKTKAIPSSAYGDLDEVVEGVENTLKFTPVGEFEHLSVLFPYAETLPGQSIFGTADAPLLIQPLDTTQPQITFHAAAISKMPDLNFAATETLFGDVEFSFVGKNNTATDAADYYFTSANNALTGASPYDPDALIVQAYDLAWGLIEPFDSFNSREGVKVSFSLKTTADTADAIGVYDKIFSSLGVTASLIPSGITEADLLTAAAVQGAESVRGRKLSASGRDLNITGDGVYFRIYRAGIRKSQLVYGSEKQRIAPVEFVASRSVGAGGTLNPLFYIGTAAPV